MGGVYQRRTTESTAIEFVVGGIRVYARSWIIRSAGGDAVLDEGAAREHSKGFPVYE